LLLYAIKVTCI